MKVVGRTREGPWRRYTRGLAVGLVGLLAWGAATFGLVLGWHPPWMGILWWSGLAAALAGVATAASAMTHLRRLPPR